jgi:hypothetical protein
MKKAGGKKVEEKLEKLYIEKYNQALLEEEKKKVLADAEFRKSIEFLTVEEIIQQFPLEKIKALAYCLRVPENLIQNSSTSNLALYKLVEELFSTGAGTGVSDEKKTKIYCLINLENHPAVIYDSVMNNNQLRLVKTIEDLHKNAAHIKDIGAVTKFKYMPILECSSKPISSTEEFVKESVNLFYQLYRHFTKIRKNMQLLFGSSTINIGQSEDSVLNKEKLINHCIFGCLYTLTGITTSGHGKDLFQFWSDKDKEMSQEKKTSLTNEQLVDTILFPVYTYLCIMPLTKKADKSVKNVLPNVASDIMIVENFISILINEKDEKDEVKNKEKTVALTTSVKLILSEILKKNIDNSINYLVIPWTATGDGKSDNSSSVKFIVINSKKFVDEFFQTF